MYSVEEKRYNLLVPNITVEFNVILDKPPL